MTAEAPRGRGAGRGQELLSSNRITTPTTLQNIDAALAYARRGWPVFPLYSSPIPGRCSCSDKACEHQGKHPRTRNGLTDATTDVAKIQSWWSMFPTANIGISCGPSGLTVIDIDPRHGGDESWRDIVEKHGPFPDTVTAQTGGGGQHIVFRTPPGEIVHNVSNSDRFTGPLGPGVDVRALGGYIVAAPSGHVSGGDYLWYADHSPDELAVAWLPDSLLELLAPKVSQPHEPVDTVSILEGVEEGGRDWELFRLAAKLRGSDVPIDWAYRLIGEAAANCTPPFPATDARKKVDSAYKRYEPGKGAFTAEPTDAADNPHYFVFASELDSLPDPEWLVEGIAPKDALGALVGKWGSGKTFALLDIACCIATGLPWHGHGVAEGQVVYVYAEGARGIKARVRAWEESNRRTVKNVAFVPRSVNFLESGDVDELLGHIMLELPAPALIVVDTLARNMAGGDENSPKDMGRVIESADRLRSATGAAVWFAHHFNRKDEYRGHSSFPGAMDTMAEIRADDKHHVVITCDKVKDDKDFEAIHLVMVPYANSVALETEDTWNAQQRTIAETRGQEAIVLKALAPDGMTFSEWRKAAGLPDSSFERHQKSLGNRGLVRKLDSGLWILTTPNPHTTPNEGMGVPGQGTPITPTPFKGGGMGVGPEGKRPWFIGEAPDEGDEQPLICARCGFVADRYDDEEKPQCAACAVAS